MKGIFLNFKNISSFSYCLFFVATVSEILIGIEDILEETNFDFNV